MQWPAELLSGPAFEHGPAVRALWRQGFNWESWKHNWFEKINQQAQEIADLGFTAVWLPPFTGAVLMKGVVPSRACIVHWVCAWGQANGRIPSAPVGVPPPTSRELAAEMGGGWLWAGGMDNMYLPCCRTIILRSVGLPGTWRQSCKGIGQQ